MRLVLLGPPGAGKGTQARRIADRLRVPAISTGEMFRAAVTGQTKLGRRAKAHLDAGDLVPDEITIAVIRDRLAQPDVQAGFVLDGFPRTLAQAEALRALLAELRTQLDCALELVVEDAELIHRLSERRLLVDGVWMRRGDDNPETVRHRLAVYRQKTAPLLRYYQSHGLLVRVDATGPVEEVTERAMAALRAAATRGSVGQGHDPGLG